MDLAQFARQSFLQIVEEFLDAGQSDACQMTETHLFHVEHKDYALVWAQLVQADIYICGK